MRRIIELVIVLLCVTVSTFAQSASDYFRQATELKNLGKYEQAIALYNKSKSTDPAFSADCDYWIDKLTALIKGSKVSAAIKVSEDKIAIPYQGGEHEILIYNAEKWEAVTESSWVVLKKKNNLLVVSCMEPNESLTERHALIEIKRGDDVKMVKVVQKETKEYLYASSENLYFPSRGGVTTVEISSNGDWKPVSKPLWCDLSRNGNVLSLKVEANQTNIEKAGQIQLMSLTGLTISVNVIQSAREKELIASKNKLFFNKKGSQEDVVIYSNGEPWTVVDYPSYCSLRTAGDTLKISCASNRPVNQVREGRLELVSGNRTMSIMLYQEALPKPGYVPAERIVESRKVSFGVFAGYVMPFVSADSKSGYVASAINYGVGTDDEEARYLSPGGFNIGALIDVRLYKNLFLLCEASYRYYQYNRTFDYTCFREIRSGGSLGWYGITSNLYYEKYNMNSVDVSAALAYRFRISEKSHWGIKLGPVLSYGFSSSLEINGRTSSDKMENQVNSISSQWKYNAEGYLDLYSPVGIYRESHTNDYFADREVLRNPVIDDAPFNKFSMGLSVGCHYELKGFSIGLEYCHMLTDIARSGFWDKSRFEVFTYGLNEHMSGYSQYNHCLTLKLGYTFRYAKK